VLGSQGRNGDAVDEAFAVNEDKLLGDNDATLTS